MADWTSFAIQAAALGVKTHAALRALGSRSPWDYFDDDGPESEWILVPQEFRSLVMRHVENPVADEATWDGEPSAERVVLGHVDGHAVGWIQSGDNARLSDGPFVRRGVETETFAAVGRAVWATLSDAHLSFGATGLTRDLVTTRGTKRSRQAAELLARIARFRKSGHSRSVLLVGPPGTGKSHAIRSISHGLGVSTLRVELAALLDKREAPRVEEVQDGLETLVRMLDPEAIVLDDIDRVGGDVRLLRFLEEAAAAGRIVLASANGTSDMLGALLRPGRFDEVVHFEHLERDLVESLLGADADLADRVETLPMAYVREFVLRLQVLGRETALKELPALEARAAKTRLAD